MARASRRFILSTATSVLAAALLVAPAVAAAQAAPAEQQLEAIREQIFGARFSEAIDAARAFLDRSDLSAAERNAGLEALAVARIANRQRDEADATLRTLYARDPGHRLTDPDASPPVVSAFARAREATPTPVTVSLEHQTPALTRREPPALEVRVVENEDAVAELRLTYRIGDEGPSRVVMTRRPDGSYVARVPVVGDPSQPTDVAYHVVALAPSMTPLAQIGSEAEPLQLRIPAEAPGGAQAVAPSGAPPIGEDEGGGSVAEEWWFWTLIGVLVVGGAVTAGILLGPAQQGPEAGTLGTVRLMQVEF